jgi:acyl carrier protein
MIEKTDIKTTVNQLVLSAGDGAVTQADLAAADGSLLALNYSSLAFTNLIVLLEENFMVKIDPTIDPEALISVDNITQTINEAINA